MFEGILIVGMFLSVWGSMGNGFYQLLRAQQIPEYEKTFKGFAISWIIGGMITIVAIFYILGKADEKQKQEEKPKYELIQEPVYRKIK
jgi:hypothetical protein